jgi:hypothetical protein
MQMQPALVFMELAFLVAVSPILASECCSKPRNNTALMHVSTLLATAACPVLSLRAAARGVRVCDVARAGGPLQDVPQRTGAHGAASGWPE